MPTCPHDNVYALHLRGFRSFLFSVFIPPQVRLGFCGSKFKDFTFNHALNQMWVSIAKNSAAQLSIQAFLARDIIRLSNKNVHISHTH